MATKLKNLSVSSVDLVDQGANPDAHIRLFKRGNELQGTDPDIFLFKKFIYWLKKGYSDTTTTGAEETIDNNVDTVEKEAQTFAENISREQLRYVTSEMFDCCYALSDSLSSIICDNTLTAEAKKSLMEQSIDEFTATTKGATIQWSVGNRMQSPNPQTEVQKSLEQQEVLKKLLGKYNLGNEQTTESENETIKKEVIDTMNIDKSRMTPEEQATLAELEKKYGIPDVPATETSSAGITESISTDSGVTKGTDFSSTTGLTPKAAGGELHPEVAKALADFQELTKRQSAEVEELKKSLEVERLTTVAKKYEILGKKSDELAVKLYELRKAGGTVYDDYIALLDENVDMLTKSGMFREIGSSRQGSVGTEETLGIKAQELQKSAAGGMTAPDAIIKAWEENPDLAAQYEAEYMGR